MGDCELTLGAICQLNLALHRSRSLVLKDFYSDFVGLEDGSGSDCIAIFVCRLKDDLVDASRRIRRSWSELDNRRVLRDYAHPGER
eukprot:CAMPEP_0185606688 /NCGR_PEP_ID=MMETSP0436-20130131/4955_1 /TAXON_ID=626734 ORGANISM="Favella taraikaensis, Strain Fe Narragansett Bay" /NCGR_SAMPLE_ID=MMETSP0436 /ASSEMBLY_ACC=CAM_ASM_000390 /LENGTH=85 /DNA_ID=CAMNT_0028238331 /DNA_START=168 /DNA_END=422 /DNA_ORIENTATION=+